MTAYTETLANSVGLTSRIIRSGTGIGTRLYYSLGGSPEMWKEEPSRISLSISDSITGRTRLMKVLIANPRNIKDEIYTPYIRVKLVEYLTGLTIFLGRVEFSDTIWDRDYGQVLRIEARDYSYELFERKVSSDYSGAAHKRSELITHLIEDYRYSASSITTDIEVSGSSQTVVRNYTKSGKLPIELIEDLAKEDPWDDTPTGYGYDYYVDDDQVFHYFKRGSKPAGGPAANGLTVALAEAQTTSKRAMMPGYNFATQASEIVTRVTVYGTDKDGTAVSVTRPASLPSTLENSLGVIKAKEEFVWGAEMTNAQLTTYCTNRADALINYKASDNLIRGEFRIARYPYYGAAGSETLVRVGDLIHIHCSTQNIDDDYLVLEVKYEEPSSIATIKVISSTKGRTFSPFETTSILQGLRSGTDVSIASARISDLMVGSAQVGQLSADKITVSGLITLADWRNSTDPTKFDGGVVYTGTIAKTGLNFSAFDKDADDLDDVSNGSTYAKVLSTDLSAGHLKLTSSTVVSGKWYSSSGVSIDATTGINIWGTDAALTTRATETGTIQCKVNASGQISAGAGKILLDADGIEIAGDSTIYFTESAGSSVFTYMGQKTDSTHGYFYIQTPNPSKTGTGLALGANTYIPPTESSQLTLAFTSCLCSSGLAIGPNSDTANSLQFRTKNAAGDTAVDHQFRPSDNGCGYLGTASYRWYAVHAYLIGDATHKPTIYCDGLTGCPVPTSKTALDVIRKMKKPKIQNGDFGRRDYFTIDELPEELTAEFEQSDDSDKFTTKDKSLKKLKREPEYLRIIGHLLASVQELTEIVDDLKNKKEN